MEKYTFLCLDIPKLYARKSLTHKIIVYLLFYFYFPYQYEQFNKIVRLTIKSCNVMLNFFISLKKIILELN